ncbi:MAG: MinD/ParA family protein, partial [Desulfobacterales bacterium]|nr:MinD/ParA family protein [Desulfobacterales bacterium]
MKSYRPSGKVIHLANRTTDKERRRVTKPSRAANETRVIAVTSGKGGVGKTNVVANLGYSLQNLGKKVMIFDADLGLANLDVLLGLAPKFNLSHVIAGEKSLAEVVVRGPGNMLILPASSGIQELTKLSVQQKIKILTDLDFIIDDIDILLIDTAAGISSNVMDFNLTAQEIMVVVTPEPTAITDAYALMKVLSMKYAQNHCLMLVNQATSAKEADDIFRQLNLVAERFLDISIDYCGYILSDDKLV